MFNRSLRVACFHSSGQYHLFSRRESSFLTPFALRLRTKKGGRERDSFKVDAAERTRDLGRPDRRGKTKKKVVLKTRGLYSSCWCSSVGSRSLVDSDLIETYSEHRRGRK